MRSLVAFVAMVAVIVALPILGTAMTVYPMMLPITGAVIAVYLTRNRRAWRSR